MITLRIQADHDLLRNYVTQTSCMFQAGHKSVYIICTHKNYWLTIIRRRRGDYRTVNKNRDEVVVFIHDNHRA
jgi:hypothetical protein